MRYHSGTYTALTSFTSHSLGVSTVDTVCTLVERALVRVLEMPLSELRIKLRELSIDPEGVIDIAPSDARVLCELLDFYRTISRSTPASPVPPSFVFSCHNLNTGKSLVWVHNDMS